MFQLLVNNLPENRKEICKFDAIFVCNGHNAVPFIPTINGLDQFEGKQMHSHHYRKADAFKGNSSSENLQGIGNSTPTTFNAIFEL